MSEIDELRPLTAGQLLALWRESRAAAEDPLERSLLCNARVLAACCYFQGEPVFPDGAAVLRLLTGRQIETLLERLSGGDGGGETNPAFDPERFRALGEA